jgi:hypothetical protein
MTVHLKGNLRNGSDSCHALKSGGCHLNADDEKILTKARFRADHGGKKLCLVVLSVAELDLDQGGTLQEIYDRAKERCCSLCPHDVIPYLRLQHRNQPKGQSRKIAMEPIKDEEDTQHIFHMGHDDEGLWLEAYPFRESSDLWRPQEKFFFVKEKEQATAYATA